MFFVSAGLRLESHAFCFCRAVAGKPCVFFLSVCWWLECHMYGEKKFVEFVAFWLSKKRARKPKSKLAPCLADGEVGPKRSGKSGGGKKCLLARTSG